MKESKSYTIKQGEFHKFNNNADYCIGTGRMGLALQKEYFEQLKLVQEKIGFKYIRGHGLFHEDMAIYQEYKDENHNIQAEYNFTYLDLVMDSYMSLNIRPFLELGFMPKKLASDTNTIFWWQGNVTPPKSYDAWKALVQATLRHLIERYGAEEVVTWPVEVWNEPNLPGFWKDADMEEYFKLYEITARAVKEVDNRFVVGGPAICGVDDDRWMKCFMEFCRKSKSPVDMITRHHYTVQPPDKQGHYDYTELRSPENDYYSQLGVTKSIVDSYEEFKGLPIHLTEFNTSYTPKSPIHDTNCNAAYIAELLSKLGDIHESYSYWTFGDIFEEHGVPFTPFHGGFGLVANGQIPKPTFWTFNFFKQLKGDCVHRSEDCIIVSRQGKYYGVAWNKNVSRTGKTIELNFNLPIPKYNECCIMEKHVDEINCNPLKVWHDMGEPANPTKTQLDIIRESAYPLILTKKEKVNANSINYSLTLEENALIYFEICGIDTKSDRGYDYNRIYNLK